MARRVSTEQPVLHGPPSDRWFLSNHRAYTWAFLAGPEDSLIQSSQGILSAGDLSGVLTMSDGLTLPPMLMMSNGNAAVSLSLGALMRLTQLFDSLIGWPRLSDLALPLVSGFPSSPDPGGVERCCWTQQSQQLSPGVASCWVSGLRPPPRHLGAHADRNGPLSGHGECLALLQVAGHGRHVFSAHASG